MDKQAAREKAWLDHWNRSNTHQMPHTAFTAGYDAGYKAASGEWVRIETADDLPGHNGFVDVTIDHPGIRYVSIARALNGVWLDYLNDTPLQPEYKISAWRERPEPFTEPDQQTGGENGHSTTN
jgi:hypothetical protein